MSNKLDKKKDPYKRVRKVCSKCGSSDLKFDAYARWNNKTQRFELVEVFEKPIICESCEGETSVREEEIA
jgi:hypothetical protein